MPPALLRASVGPRGATGQSFILHFQNLVNDDWVQVWGVLRGPAYVQVACAPGLSTVAPTIRMMPLAVVATAGGYSAGDARALRGSGQALVETDGGESNPPSLPVIRGGTAELRWWPRVLVASQSWAPAAWVRPTLLGQLWTFYFNVTWPAGVAPGVVSVVERPVTAADLGRPETGARRRAEQVAAVRAAVELSARLSPAEREARARVRAAEERRYRTGGGALGPGGGRR